MQCRLRRGKSIHTISALLMQLVQTSAHDVQVEGKRYDKARRHLLAQGSQLGANVNEEVLLSDKDREVRLCNMITLLRYRFLTCRRLLCTAMAWTHRITPRRLSSHS